MVKVKSRFKVIAKRVVTEVRFLRPTIKNPDADKCTLDEVTSFITLFIYKIQDYKILWELSIEHVKFNLYFFRISTIRLSLITGQYFKYKFLINYLKFFSTINNC